MGEWRGWREYSYGRHNPADDEEFTMCSLEREFCESCSISMDQLIGARKMMDFYPRVMHWDDSGAEEAFRDAKRRYWASRNQLPCDLPLPNHDFFSTEIDWNSEIDPELLTGLDRYNWTDDGDDTTISRYEDTFQSHGRSGSIVELKPTGWDVPDESAKPTGRYGSTLPTFVGYIEDDDIWGDPNTCQSRDVGKYSIREEQCSDNGRHNSYPSCGEWKNDNYGPAKVHSSCSRAIQDSNLNDGRGYGNEKYGSNVYRGRNDYGSARGNLNDGRGNRNEKYGSNVFSGRNDYGSARGNLNDGRGNRNEKYGSNVYRGRNDYGSARGGPASSSDQVPSRQYRSKDQSPRNYEPAKRVAGCSDALQDLKLQVPSRNVKYPSNGRRNYGRGIRGIAKEQKWVWVPVNGSSGNARNSQGTANGSKSSGLENNVGRQ